MLTMVQILVSGIFRVGPSLTRNTPCVDQEHQAVGLT